MNIDQVKFKVIVISGRRRKISTIYPQIKKIRCVKHIRMENSPGQSINLALSIRGQEALRAVGLEDDVIKCHCIRMRGRMIHHKNGNLKEIIYDSVKGNCIYSVNRRRLNMILLDAAEKYPEVQLSFNKKLIDADLEKGKMKLLDTKTGLLEDAEADLIIGADGAHSKIRGIMARRPLFNCTQTYIEDLYVEFNVPPGKNNKFAMSGNSLHIWPRDQFMIISLPNVDRTFTSNLFISSSILERMKSHFSYFATYFPDLLQIVGEEKLLDQITKQKAQPMISIKCKPYHVGKTALIIGDAAHAMVPFYAQGMNTGFEDVLLLDELMERYNSDFAKILPKFSELRCGDAHAICDLAMYNYKEMKYLVVKRTFLLRKLLDNILYRFMPNIWIPLYNSVQFTRMSFRDCLTNKEWQDKIIIRTLWCFGFLALAVLACCVSQNNYA
ncbi:kynurenine 3-monooxygenase isoform X2 [Ooceraea biroi]|uniref:kynurenine 3-monooxygenase isoform X2 n=1 Tax=Ooceraea biroi TaxID=2015173 RepID=UPI000F0798E8|nr:kynurenine 3-monooxygenase isoform X2 [Ooceraea biroi]